MPRVCLCNINCVSFILLFKMCVSKIKSEFRLEEFTRRVVTDDGFGLEFALFVQMKKGVIYKW